MTPQDLNAALEEAGLDPLPPDTGLRFLTYLDLLIRWNAKLNLTAIRDPKEILRRHFVECIFAARMISETVATLLDFGSGAGFPGIPIAICRPETAVTLAESQSKKAAFLREAVRELGLKTSIYSGRVEAMPSGAVFDVVTLRAVDRMQDAVELAASRIAVGGRLLVMTSESAAPDLQELAGMIWNPPVRMTWTEQQVVLTGHLSVPRETLLISR